MEEVVNPAENAGLITLIQRLKEQNGPRKNNGFYSFLETKTQRNGVSFQKDLSVELTMQLKTIGILDLRNL